LSTLIISGDETDKNNNAKEPRVKQFGLFALALHLVATPAFGEQMLSFETETIADSNRFFIQSMPSAGDRFDSWTIESGYRYPLSNLSVYLGTQMKSETQTAPTQRGLLSGIEYRFTDKLHVSSQLSHGYQRDKSVNQWGVSSRYQLSDSFDVNAGLDVEFDPEKDTESIYQLGVGLRF
jgi:hypothetical protein